LKVQANTKEIRERTAVTLQRERERSRKENYAYKAPKKEKTNRVLSRKEVVETGREATKLGARR
jgi:hypothetical protein